MKGKRTGQQELWSQNATQVCGEEVEEESQIRGNSNKMSASPTGSL